MGKKIQCAALRAWLKNCLKVIQVDQHSESTQCTLAPETNQCSVPFFTPKGGNKSIACVVKKVRFDV